MVRRPYSGEAAAVGGDDIFGCSPPAGGLCPELSASSDERCAHRKKVLCWVVQLRGANAGRRTLRGGRLNFGEAEAVGGDDLFLILFSDERAVHRRCPLRKRQSGFL